MTRSLVVLTTAAVFFFACGKDEGAKLPGGPAREEPGLPGGAEGPAESLLRMAPDMLRDLRITTAPVEERPEGEGVTVLGELRVSEEAYAEVGSPIPARVIEPRASVGDTVAEGQPLVELESPDLGRSRAEVASAQARVLLARRALDRKRELAGERIVAAREVQEAEAEMTGAEAGLRAARASLRALGAAAEDATTEGARFVLSSPIRGTVIERSAVRGQATDPGSPLFRVADLSELWLVAQAFERDAVRVRVGGTARISFPALPGRSFSGMVALVGRQVDPRSRTIPVRVVVRNEGDLLRPGMSASSWLPVGEVGAAILAVPLASLQRLDDGWVAFLPRSEGEFEVRRVGRGRDLGGEVEIVSGLGAGEDVVVEGAFLLKAEAEKSHGEGEQHEH